MKKIGIMTMHRIVNYGSFLQAYALKKTIEKNLNCNVTFIDYKYEKSLVKDKNTILKKIVNNKNILNFIKKKKVQKKFISRYNNEYLIKYLEVDVNKNNNCYDIDCLIIGSDEVFNCLQTWPVGFSRELFGNNYADKVNTISYAASFGNSDYETIKEYGIGKEIGILLKKFNAISVRDENSYNIVKKLTKREPLIHLDPVLIYDFCDEIIDNVKLNDYIVLYAYTGRLTNNEEKEIKQFAKKYNKKIVSIGFYQKIADYNLIIDPFEIFAYFRHADFIITDTFHGSIIAIKTQSNYCTIIRGGNKNKVSDLLTRLHQSNRIINNIQQLEKLYYKKNDFNESNRIISNEKKRTIEYLKQQL